jgi:uncharacterized protein (DUF4415 family)
MRPFKGKKNPYAKLLKRQVTIRLDEWTVKYFKGLAANAGIPYQTLINLYLRDYAATGCKLSMEWKVALDCHCPTADEGD